MKVEIDDFTAAYIEAMLWAEIGDNEKPLEEGYAVRDIEEESLLRIARGCERFQAENADLLRKAAKLGDYRDPRWTLEERAGHDLYLTSNHHGVGFWDRGLGDAGTRLTEAAHEFGERYITEWEGKLTITGGDERYIGYWGPWEGTSRYDVAYH